jgi:hypothetical protein
MVRCLFLPVVISIGSHMYLAVPVSIIDDSTDSEQVQEIKGDDQEQGVEGEDESDDAELSE